MDPYFINSDNMAIFFQNVIMRDQTAMCFVRMYLAETLWRWKSTQTVWRIEPRLICMWLDTSVPVTPLPSGLSGQLYCSFLCDVLGALASMREENLFRHFKTYQSSYQYTMTAVPEQPSQCVHSFWCTLAFTHFTTIAIKCNPADILHMWWMNWPCQL
jgi:hypothetical protein